MSGLWHGYLARGDLVVAIDDEDLSRVGHCWAKGQLRHGDVLACLRQREIVF